MKGEKISNYSLGKKLSAHTGAETLAWSLLKQMNVQNNESETLQKLDLTQLQEVTAQGNITAMIYKK